MSAPQNECAFDLEVASAAAERWSKREQHHAKFERAARNRKYSELDTPERCAARANRLLDESIGKEIVSAGVTPEAVSDDLLERVIGKTRDLQFVEFLEKAVFANRSGGRVVAKLGSGRFCYGSGFMVSPRSLLTNHHVLPSAEVAARTTVEFDYQHDRLGREKELDFALVAVSPDGPGRALDDYMWCPLLKEPGKIVTGEPINIIQHPKGERRQVVIRENRLFDALDGADLFYHYEADTEPGSSGSPVFND